jgi:cellulose synthase/poly-beta-1,6-N-acetylglucosamine synthase-like glycosyltransferase
MVILEIIYLLNAFLLAVYGINSLLLTWVYLRAKKAGRIPLPIDPTFLEFPPVYALRESATPGRRSVRSLPVGQTGLERKETHFLPVGNLSSYHYPPVTVQLPIYNERHVAERLLEAAVKLSWPAERLQIQVLDDSTDDTSQIIAAALVRLQAQGITIPIQHIRREKRSGYRAGALQFGLRQAGSDFIAIFDADFLPLPDFLEKTVPLFFDDEKIGCVQTRWGHLNANTSKLTQAQALGIDGHFVVEQSARDRLGAFLNFNGTAGVWRRSCMSDAGGWQGDTLTEDLDLSYRAQLRGWRIAYRPQVIVPAELPVQIDALKRQQFRWAKGSMQTAIKLLPLLWQASRPLWLKILGTLHLTNYSVHPLMFISLLLTLPMTLSNSIFLLVTPLFALSAIGPPSMYWVAMQIQDWPLSTSLGRLGLLIALGTGLSASNTKAVMEAVFGFNSEFKRTPKFAVVNQSTAWQHSLYTLPSDPLVWVELILAGYAWALLAWSIVLGIWWLIPWLVLYSSGYTYVSILTFVQARQTRAARTHRSRTPLPIATD